MSVPETEPRKSPQTPAGVLTDSERSAVQKIGANPMELLGSTESRSYIEGIVETLLPTQKALEALVARIAHPVGFYLVVPDDLTANAAEYVYTHPLTGLTYLYANGAAVSQATYADLYALWGANKYGADSGGNFLLPDARGRSLWLAGTNTNTDVGDTDGQAESTREPKHKHTKGTLGITGAPTAGTLATASAGAHTHTVTVNLSSGVGGSGGDAPAGNNTGVAQSTAMATVNSQGAHTHSLTGAPGVGTLGVTGEAGSGMGGSDAVAHIVIGSLVIRF